MVCTGKGAMLQVLVQQQCRGAVEGAMQCSVQSVMLCTVQSAMLSMHNAEGHGVNAQCRVPWCQCTVHGAMLCKLQGAMLLLMSPLLLQSL